MYPFAPAHLKIAPFQSMFTAEIAECAEKKNNSSGGLASSGGFHGPRMYPAEPAPMTSAMSATNTEQIDFSAFSTISGVNDIGIMHLAKAVR
jgi:hypothetical protein